MGFDFLRFRRGVAIESEFLLRNSFPLCDDARGLIVQLVKLVLARSKVVLCLLDLVLQRLTCSRILGIIELQLNILDRVLRLSDVVIGQHHLSLQIYEILLQRCVLAI